MKKTYTIISNTHWDREWRQSFQRHRMALVTMLDSLLDILDSQPDYAAFHLDSQSVVLEDYLEVRPQQRQRLEAYIRQGRILVGPWYILPDEFFVGGENLIRNLLLGHRVSREHGRVSKIGYSPFSWGQISQLPQIYAGFGIDLIMFYRGVNSLDSPQAEFIWEGADGTRALSSRFSTMPRYNFYFGIYRPVVQGYTAGDVKYDMNFGGTLLHPADPSQAAEDYHRQDAPSHYDPARIEAAVHTLSESQDKDFSSGQVIWMEGHDSSGPSPETSRLIKDLKQRFPDWDIRHGTLEEYRQALLDTVDREALPLVQGERRSAQYDHRSGNMYAYTLSARMYLKQINFDAERWLQTYAEPMDTLAGLLGMDHDDRYLELAWKMLIQNSAHDSVGGCSLDAVHEDGLQRYRTVMEISQGVFRRGFEFLARRIGGLDLATGEQGVVLFNPLPQIRSGVHELVIDLPAGESTTGLSISDSSGRTCRYQVLRQTPAQPVLEQLTDRPLYVDVTRYHCLVDIPEIPGLGWQSLKVAAEKSEQSAEAQGDRVTVSSPEVPIMENANLRAEWSPDGRFSLTHKDTNRTYEGLGEFYDEGEAGNAWVHTPVGPFFSSRDTRAEFQILLQGPLAASIQVSISLSDLDRSAAEAPRPMQIVAVYTLLAGSPILNVAIEVNNQARDHRLRMVLPTSMLAHTSFGEGQFDVVARTVARPDTSDWVEQPMVDHPMHNFVDVTDGQRGLAVLVDGLKEYEVSDEVQQKLFITLFRAFRHVVVPSSVEDHGHEPGSQCLGMQNYRLAIMPHQGSWQQAGVLNQALAFNNGLKAMQASCLQGDLPAAASLFKIDSNALVITALKTPEHGKPGVILRLSNPGEQTVTSGLDCWFPLSAAFITNLEETEDQELRLESKQRLQLSVGPKKIVTLRLVVEHE